MLVHFADDPDMKNGWYITVVRARAAGAKKHLSMLFADRSYGAQAFRDVITVSGAEVVIALKNNSQNPYEYDIWHYQERHLTECFIGKIQHLFLL